MKAEKSVAHENGKKVDCVVLRHGPYPVVAFDRGSFVQLAVIIEIPEKDSELLAKQPTDITDRLFTVLKAAMLQGRTGFNWKVDGKKLKQIMIEQRIIVAPDRQESIQRLLDGIQELVVIGVRVSMILGEAFSGPRDTGKTSAPPPPDGMYA